MFEAVARIVRLLDTIKAPGSPGHLSRPSGEGKVVEPTRVSKKARETNRKRRPPAEAEPPQGGKPPSGGSSLFGPRGETK